MLPEHWGIIMDFWIGRENLALWRGRSPRRVRYRDAVVFRGYVNQVCPSHLTHLVRMGFLDWEEVTPVTFILAWYPPTERIERKLYAHSEALCHARFPYDPCTSQKYFLIVKKWVVPRETPPDTNRLIGYLYEEWEEWVSESKFWAASGRGFEQPVTNKMDEVWGMTPVEIIPEGIQRGELPERELIQILY